jgi:hypothetical protein
VELIGTVLTEKDLCLIQMPSGGKMNLRARKISIWSEMSQIQTQESTSCGDERLTSPLGYPPPWAHLSVVRF